MNFRGGGAEHKFSLKGFTLAEVLITLGVIGVVAAMTLPALITKYQKQQTVARLKENYSIVSQAVKLSELDNGLIEDWDMSMPASDFYKTYLSKYIKSAEEVSLSKLKKRVSYKYLNGGSAEGAVYNDRFYVAKLSNGTFLFIDGWSDANGLWRGVEFDLNGFSKPNQIGIDVFYLRIDKTLKAFTMYNANIPGQGCTSTAMGYNCSNKIMADGWEIKDDYPWK